MTKQVWLPVDGALLKKLREDAGVEITTLARLHSLSTSQIKQLENGGDSSFYTPSIKLATGRKLLMHFGADIQPLEQEAEQLHAAELETPAKAVDATQATNVELEKKNSLLSLQIVGAVVVLISLIYWSFFHSEVVSDKEPVTVGKKPTTTSPIESSPWPGKSDAMCPSGPMPRIVRSNAGRPCPKCLDKESSNTFFPVDRSPISDAGNSWMLSSETATLSKKAALAWLAFLSELVLST
jgi:DNA-binding XRE family transcriptional regulator